MKCELNRLLADWDTIDKSECKRRLRLALKNSFAADRKAMSEHELALRSCVMDVEVSVKTLRKVIMNGAERKMDGWNS